jgi:hypothetical protein
MDPKEIFPVPYHPAAIDRTRDFRGKVRSLPRSGQPVKYYWIDFGLARRYQPNQLPPSEKVVLGADQSPPEHKDPKSRCDPFPTDVYFAGNLVREYFLTVRSATLSDTDVHADVSCPFSLIETWTSWVHSLSAWYKMSPPSGPQWLMW